MSLRIPKKLFVVLFLLIVSVLGIAMFGESNTNPFNQQDTSSDAVQIKVKAGYSPREVVLPANKQGVIQFITNNTYDCSASLLIPPLNIEQFLPPTGTTSVQIPPQPAGTEIIAGCAMGMYSFKIKFL